MAGQADTAPEPGYPAHWEADVVLRDGGTAHLRAIRPEDSAAIERFHSRQSPESIYLRFFAPMPRLSEADVYHFTHVDHASRVALVCTLGDDIIGIGRYERLDQSTAEVAFNVSDVHHGRGLGTVLLEHLAAAARENGLHRFVAEVLPQNQKMMTVFRDAGFEVRSAYEDGVITLQFDIDPTEASIAVMEAREHRAEARSVHTLLNPASVAVVGASRRPGTVGHRLLADLLDAGFTGRLHVVHPEADSVLGVPAVQRLAEIGEPVDLVAIAVPAPAVLDVVAQCAATGVRGLAVLSSGFAETGVEGSARQGEMVRLARANGMRVVGPNSWGVINADPRLRLNVSLASRLPDHGRLGLFCESGALSAVVLAEAASRGLGLSTFLSAGNRADVSGNDCMQYWEEDTGTDAVGLYLEVVGNPRKFSRIARRLATRKPVIVLTSGASGLGVARTGAARAAQAPHLVLDALLRQSGCIQVDSVPRLFDVAQLVLHQPMPEGSGVAVVGNSDALATLIADACSGWDLRVVHGPVSLAPQAGIAQLREALADACRAPGVHSVVAAFVPPVATAGEEVAEALSAGAVGVPVVACLPGVPPAVGPGTVPRVPTYRTPEEAVHALAAVTRYGAWCRRDPGQRVDPRPRDTAAARDLVAGWLAGRPEGVQLSAEQAAQLLACYGIHVWPVLPAPDPDVAVAAADRLGWPIAVKTTAPHLRHRVDLRGVRLDVADAAQLRRVVAEMHAQLTPLGGADLVVQRMAPPGVACLVRSTEDPLFGPVVTFGLGGDASDLLGDLAHRIPPLTDVDIADLIRSVRAAPKLFGHRGARPVAVGALEDVIARVSCLADDLPEAAELELNPVNVHEQGAAVLDVAVRLAAPQARADARPRELPATGAW